MAVELSAEREGIAPARRNAAAATRELDTWLLSVLLLLACGIECVLVVFVRRLSLERYPRVIPTPQPIASVLGVTEKGLTWFVVAFGVLVGCYIFAYAVALRIGDRRGGLIALAVSAVLIATMIPVFPGGAHDVEHNIVDARTLWVYGENPITTPPSAHPNDPFTAQLFDWQSLTSSYGPVWYALAGAPLPFTGDGLVRNVVGQKLLVSVFLLGTVCLVYLIMSRRRPRSATAAVVLLGWSPLLLWEIPGNAHNDIVMMFFAVAALLAVQRGRWQFAFPLLALAIATKFIMLLVVPLLLVWLVLPKDGSSLGRNAAALLRGSAEARRRAAGRLRRECGVPLGEIAVWFAVGASVLVVVYLPFLLSSFTIANHAALQNRYIASPTSLAISFLMQYRSLTTAEDYARALAITCYVLGYLFVLLRLRRTLEGLIAAAFWAIFLTLVFPTWWFWPWYLAWLIPVAALLAGRKAATVALVFGSSALLMYAIYYWRDILLGGDPPGMSWYANQFVIVGAIFGPVALYLLGASGVHLLTFDAASDRAPSEPGESMELPAA